MNARAKKHPARLTWVCGTEPVLRDEVVDWVTRTVNPAYYVQKQAGESVDAVWEALSTKTLYGGSSLIVIRQAEQIEKHSSSSSGAPGWRNLPGLLDALHLGDFGDRYVVFTADQGDYWTRNADGSFVASGVGERSRTALPHVSRFLKSTMCDVVVCSGLSADVPRNKFGSILRDSDAVLWCRSHCPPTAQIGTKEAEHLIRTTGGEIRAMRDVLAKAACFGTGTGSGPTIGVLDVLTGSTRGAARSFTEHLIAGQKAHALALGAQITTTAALRTELRGLSRALDALGVLHAARRNHKSRSEALRGAPRDSARDSARDSGSSTGGMDARQRAQLTSWDIERWWTHAPAYDPRRRSRARVVLAELDAELAHRPEHQSPPGALEALVAAW